MMIACKLLPTIFSGFRICWVLCAVVCRSDPAAATSVGMIWLGPLNVFDVMSVLAVNGHSALCSIAALFCGFECFSRVEFSSDRALRPLFLFVAMKNLRALRPQVLASAYSGFSIATEPSVNHRHPPRVPNLIGGAFVDSKSTATIDVINHKYMPWRKTGEVIRSPAMKKSSDQNVHSSSECQLPKYRISRKKLE
ncbi:hypothetical protein DITRI_Ditri19aG0044800 [Diplodiscus trichospermus]